jgi:hypothetical protein
MIISRSIKLPQTTTAMAETRLYIPDVVPANERERIVVIAQLHQPTGPEAG